MLKQIVLTAGILLGAATTANAVTLFSDNFDADALRLNVGNLGDTSLNNWTVGPGTVDVIGPNFYDFYPSNGNYLDMDGSTSQAGTINTNKLFNIVSGRTYTISFDYGKNGAAAETLNFGIGSYAASLMLLGGAIPSLLNNTYTFLATTNETGVSLFFQGVGGDNQGPVLDNVSLSAVPLPGAAPLLIAALAGFGAMARRRKFVAKA
jgi:Protein of unknown function (DUF642)